MASPHPRIRKAAVPALAALVLAAAPAGVTRTATAAPRAGSPGSQVATALAKSAALSLPWLPGQFQVGTVAMEMVDHSRLDPFAPARQPRALMVQLWYPAVHTDRYPLAPYMATGAARYEDQEDKLPPGTFESVRTQGHLGAPLAPARSGWPVLLFSPGSGTSRSLYTTLIEDLASQGYLVVAIDHPYDADVVEFPDGHLVLKSNLPDQDKAEAVRVRAQDASFVLGQLHRLNAGELAPGWRGSLDLTRAGMFGHSMGGATAAAAMLADPRITAGADMDGTFYGPVVSQGLDRPFMLMGSALHDRTDDDTWAQLWSQLRGWRLNLKLAESGHYNYSDIGVLAAPLNLTSLYPPGQLPYFLGTIDGTRASVVEQAYLTAFFDHTLRHKDEPLLLRPDPHYPEIYFGS